MATLFAHFRRPTKTLLERFVPRTKVIIRRGKIVQSCPGAEKSQRISGSSANRSHSLARGVPKVDVKRTPGTTVSNSRRDAPGSRGWGERVLTLTDVTSLYHGTRLPPRWEETFDAGPRGNSSYWHSWNGTVTCYRVMRKACGSSVPVSMILLICT